MKYLIYILAILDLATCFYMSYLLEMFVFDFLHILFLLLFISFIASAILLVWEKKLGILLNFIQFPFRVYFAIYSFWFISSLFKGVKDIAPQFFIFATILEICRLIISFVTYRKLKKTYK